MLLARRFESLPLVLACQASSSGGMVPTQSSLMRLDYLSIGNNRDALGFDYFFEAGLALETDISQNDWPVKKLRLGVMGIFGADVTG